MAYLVRGKWVQGVFKRRRDLFGFLLYIGRRAGHGNIRMSAIWCHSGVMGNWGRYISDWRLVRSSVLYILDSGLFQCLEDHGHGFLECSVTRIPLLVNRYVACLFDMRMNLKMNVFVDAFYLLPIVVNEGDNEN